MSDMDIRCLLGFHDWETEYFGGGFPFRECRRCHRCEVRMIGALRWTRPAEGNTLESTRRMYDRFGRQERLGQQLEHDLIGIDQYREGMDQIRGEIEAEGVE